MYMHKYVTYVPIRNKKVITCSTHIHQYYIYMIVFVLICTYSYANKNDRVISYVREEYVYIKRAHVCA